MMSEYDDRPEFLPAKIDVFKSWFRGNRKKYKKSKEDKEMDLSAFFVYVLFGLLIIGNLYFSVSPFLPDVDFKKDCNKAKEQGTKQILESAHYRAVNSIDTINIAEYELVSNRRAERDSARCARKVKKFIKHSGNRYLYRLLENPRDYISYVLQGDESVGTIILKTDLVNKEPEFQKILHDYEVAIQQLAVQRRISNQKQ